MALLSDEALRLIVQRGAVDGDLLSVLKMMAEELLALRLQQREFWESQRNAG